MTPRRTKIDETLAAAGRPKMWANEQETARLCGMSFDTYKEKIDTLEMRGFPRKNEVNGKRAIPAILAFWKLDSKSPSDPAIPLDIRQFERF